MSRTKDEGRPEGPGTGPGPREERLMRRCLELARKGAGAVAPNPLVGAVVECDGRVVGEGFHGRFGGPHAEVEAVAAVADRSVLERSTLYVSLEPCAHHGKTPPCTELILGAGIPRVVIGCRDQNPLVDGDGSRVLRDAGVEVVSGVCEEECILLNRRFFTNHRFDRPFVILKWAATRDGFIARDDMTSRWISCPESRLLVHRWRAEEAAVLVGTNTAQFDDPSLTVRGVDGSNPVRIVFDRRLRLSENLKLFTSAEAPTWVLNELKEGKRGHVTYIKLDDETDVVVQILAKLHARGVQSLMVEGGSNLLNAFIAADLWDEARVFRSSATFGTGIPEPLFQTAGRDAADTQFVGAARDVLTVYRNHWVDLLLHDPS